MNKQIGLVYFFMMILFGSCKNTVSRNPSETSSSKKMKTTVLVYMAADNDLESYAIQNLKQMERAKTENLNVLVLFDRAEGYDQTNEDWTDTRLYEVHYDKSNSAAVVSKRLDCPGLGLSVENETELDMGNHTVLSSFIDFAKTRYKQCNYVLIIWGHGTGWKFNSCNSRAVAIDDKTDSYMSVKNLGLALEDKNLDIVGFDTCFGGVFENLYEIRNCCEYIVASPDVTPSVGWNYTQLLEDLSQSDFDGLTSAQIMAECSSVQTSIIESSKLEEVMVAFEHFSKRVSENINTGDERDTVFNTLFSTRSYCYSQYPCDMYIDMYEMAGNFSVHENVDIQKSAKELQEQIKISGETTHNQTLRIGVHFIPKTSAQTIATQHSSEYLKSSNNTTQCSFIKESNWWVPTEGGKSDSLLDKLFYRVF